MKGGTARVLRVEFPELEEFLWGESFWADGYFAETVGQQEEVRVREYICNQKSTGTPPQKSTGTPPQKTRYKKRPERS